MSADRSDEPLPEEDVSEDKGEIIEKNEVDGGDEPLPEEDVREDEEREIIEKNEADRSDEPLLEEDPVAVPTPPPTAPPPTAGVAHLILPLAQNREQTARQPNGTLAILLCIICLAFLAMIVGIVGGVYHLTNGVTAFVYNVTYTELDGGGGGTNPTVLPTLAPSKRCRFSASSYRREVSIPSDVSALMSDCRRCVKDAGFAAATPLCSLWCAPPDDEDAAGDPWIVLSRRNFSRKITASSSSSSSDCIFGSAAATEDVFASGFGCDEEVFLGLDKLVAATDPDGANRDMLEMRVVISDGGSGGNDGVGGSGSIVADRSEFFVNSSLSLFYEASRHPSKTWPYLASVGNGAAFCANSASEASALNVAACDPAVRGAYWRDAETGQMTLCAACCEEKHFGGALNGRQKIMEVLFRKKRCLNGDARTKRLFYQMKIPPVLECFREGATIEVALETPMGKTRIKGGKNKHKFWCSNSGGMKILERNPSLDAAAISDAFNISDAAFSPTKCLFDATEEDWSSSKYQSGFGCGHQFFVGTRNAARLSEKTPLKRLGPRKSGSLDKGILKLKIEFDDNQSFEEEADIKKIDGLSLALDPSSISDRSNNNSILGAYTRDIVSRFCDRDDVTQCANLTSRWWLLRKENAEGINEFMDDVCLTSCDSKRLIMNIGSWEKRDITSVQMFIDNE